MFTYIPIICFICSLLLTPIVKKFAIRVNAIDIPKSRKVHTKPIPRLGGLAIFIPFLLGIYLIGDTHPYIYLIVIAASVIIITGIFDDLFELRAYWKLIGQILAASVIVFGGIKINFINIPFTDGLTLGLWGIPLTFLWIIIVTNSINLIDGLDGLAAGISTIVLLTIVVLSFFNGITFVTEIGIITAACTLGFLYHNFYPAKIFMGDTGALFLGFIISVISLLEFKNVTLFSLLVPAIILGVPLSDTTFAIIRRFYNKLSIAQADKSHLHHCLLNIGFSHVQAVLFLYGLSIFFSLAAVVFSRSTLWVGLITIGLLLLLIEVIGELLGLINKEYRPIINLFTKMKKRISKVFGTVK